MTGMWREWNTYSLLMGIYTATSTIDIRVEVPPKAINRTTMWSNNENVHSWHITKIFHNPLIDTCSFMFISVLIHNSQEMETDWMSINRGVDNENEICMHSQILFTNKCKSSLQVKGWNCK